MSSPRTLVYAWAVCLSLAGAAHAGMPGGSPHGMAPDMTPSFATLEAPRAPAAAEADALDEGELEEVGLPADCRPAEAPDDLEEASLDDLLDGVLGPEAPAGAAPCEADHSEDLIEEGILPSWMQLE